MGRVKIRADKWNANDNGIQPTIYEWENVLMVSYDAELRSLSLLHENKTYSITLDVPKGYEIIIDGIEPRNIDFH